VIPTFGEIFGEPIPAYFAMLMAAFAACTWFAVRWAKRERRDHDVLIDLALISLITGVAGARIAHVLFDGFLMDYVHLCTDPSQVAWPITPEQCASEWVQGRWDEAASVCRPTEGDCFAWAKFWQGGLTWYGGMIGGIAYGMYFLKKEGFPRIKTLDMGGMVLPLGLFFGRMGCWFGGCCFGQPSDAWWAVSFPPWSPASESQWRAHLLSHPSEASLPVIPTQLLEGFGSLVLAFVIIGLVEPRKRFDGQVFCISMIGYAILRFGLEFLRADDRGGMLALSTSQWISILLVVAVGAAWPVLQRHSAARFAALRPRASEAPEPSAA
jgi:phosphatidylglycerol:prolipoprotein diacylglycerol transferase